MILQCRLTVSALRYKHVFEIFFYSYLFHLVPVRACSSIFLISFFFVNVSLMFPFFFCFSLIRVFVFLVFFESDLLVVCRNNLLEECSSCQGGRVTSPQIKLWSEVVCVCVCVCVCVWMSDYGYLVETSSPFCQQAL